MVGWCHLFNGHELGQTPGDVEEQEGLACCSPWGHKESDTTERLNSNMESREKKGLMNLVKKGLVDTVEEGKGGMN